MDTGIVLISLSRHATLTGVNLIMNILPVLSFPECAFRIFSPRPSPLDVCRTTPGPTLDESQIVSRKMRRRKYTMAFASRSRKSFLVSCTFSHTSEGLELFDLDVSPGFPHGEIGQAHGHLIEFASVVAFPRISSMCYAGVRNGPFLLRPLTGSLVSNGSRPHWHDVTMGKRTKVIKCLGPTYVQ